MKFHKAKAPSVLKRLCDKQFRTQEALAWITIAHDRVFCSKICSRSLSEAIAAAISDRRQAGKIQHAIHELLSQRLYAIACGYPDGNDAARLG